MIAGVLAGVAATLICVSVPVGVASDGALADMFVGVAIAAAFSGIFAVFALALDDVIKLPRFLAAGLSIVAMLVIAIGLIVYAADRI